MSFSHQIIHRICKIINTEFLPLTFAMLTVIFIKKESSLIFWVLIIIFKKKKDCQQNYLKKKKCFCHTELINSFSSGWEGSREYLHFLGMILPSGQKIEEKRKTEQELLNISHANRSNLEVATRDTTHEPNMNTKRN